MRTFTALCATLLCAVSVSAGTSVAVGGDFGDLKFGFLYSDHYRAEPTMVRETHSWLDESDLLVALHLGERSGIDLKVILDWRRDGRSWDDITHRCKLGSDIYFVEVPENSGPPYGRALGHWKKHRQQAIELSDEEIRAFVELRVLSDFSGRSPAEVLRMKKDGGSPASIAGKDKSASKGKPEGKGKSASPASSKGKDKGKGKH